MAAGLFFVFALRVGFAANRFAVGNFRRVNRQLDVIALAQLGHHHLNVLLSRAAQQKFLGLRIAPETQRQIFLQNFVNRHADAIFIRARLRLHGKSDRRLGHARRRIDKSARSCRPSVSPVVVSFNFAIAPMSPACNSFTSVSRLSLHHLHVLKAFLRIAVEILQRRIVLQHARNHLEIIDAPRERIGQRLEHKKRHRLGVA